MTCVRAQHGLTSTPNQRFYATPIEQRMARYALPLGSVATPMPLDAAARRAWSARVDAAERVPHPAPQVPARQAYAGEVPSGARALAELAAARGWQGAITYARGNGVHSSHGAVLGLRHSLAVRLWHPDGRRAVALWLNAAAAGGWTMVPGDMPRKVGVKAVTAWIKGE